MSVRLKHAFAPIAAPDARLLILGSLPGDASLAADRYYAHPTNAFWWLLGEVVGTPLAQIDYAQRLDVLRAHRIALWDVIASADRPGSLDGAIRVPKTRDLVTFAATLPDLRAVAFNGATAARHARKQFGSGSPTQALLDLPSSSAAYAGMTRAAKRERWLALRAYL